MNVVDLNSSEWGAFLGTAPSATIFHANKWLAVLARTYGCEIRRLGFLEGGCMVAGIPVVVRRKFIYRIAGSPASGLVTPYQGPVCREPTRYIEAFEAFWRYAGSAGWDFVEVTPPPDNLPVDCRLKDPQIRYEPQRTVHLDLTLGEAKLFQEMDPECRRAIRAAKKRGAEVTEVDAGGDEWIDSYFHASSEMYRRQGRPPAIPRTFFENLRDIFMADLRLKILIAVYRSEVIAGAVFLVDRETLYFCDGVSRSAYNHLRPSNLIHWTIICWACMQGLRTYDMLGANIPSIARFKKGFGGRFVPYVTYRRSQDWLARVGERGYRLLAPTARRVAARLGR